MEGVLEVRLERVSEILVIIVVFSSDHWPSEVAIIVIIVNQTWLRKYINSLKSKQYIPGSGKRSIGRDFFPAFLTDLKTD